MTKETPEEIAEWRLRMHVFRENVQSKLSTEDGLESIISMLSKEYEYPEDCNEYDVLNTIENYEEDEQRKEWKAIQRYNDLKLNYVKPEQSSRKIELEKQLCLKRIETYEKVWPVKVNEDFWSYYEQLKKAAKLCERLGLTDRAIQNYVRAKFFENAGDAAQKAGMNEEALKCYIAQIDYLEKRQQKLPTDLLNAAKMARKAGLTDRMNKLAIAAVNQEEERDYRWAAKLAEEFELNDWALELYAKANVRNNNLANQAKDYIAPARLAKKIGKLEEAKKLYIQGIHHLEISRELSIAGRIAEEAGLTEQVQLYKSMEEQFRQSLK